MSGLSWLIILNGLSGFCEMFVWQQKSKPIPFVNSKKRVPIKLKPDFSDLGL